MKNYSKFFKTIKKGMGCELKEKTKDYISQKNIPSRDFSAMSSLFSIYGEDIMVEHDILSLLYNNVYHLTLREYKHKFITNMVGME